MSDERLEAARAEAERFVDKEFPAHGWSASFRQYAANVYVDGVQWADGNPQPTTITQDQRVDLYEAANTLKPEHFKTWIRDELGIEVEDER